MSKTAKPHRHSKLLFILKRRDQPYTGEHCYSKGGLSSGLLNSAKFVVEMLLAEGVHAKLVQVQDNNCIDREVSAYKPTHVIIEAYWVVPEKFEVLKRLHPQVTWIVRNHSEMPFLAQEGVAMDWTLEYLRRGILVAPNSEAMVRDVKTVAKATVGEAVDELVVWLPNYYPLPKERSHFRLFKPGETLDVGLFGAVRPLKNQLLQAVAALEYAESRALRLRLHINATRVEEGNNNLKNIRALFAHSHVHELVEHPWCEHQEFLRLVSTMDVNMCVSFSETFCIVAADGVAMGVPTVGSNEIRWLSELSRAVPTDSKAIVWALECALNHARMGTLQHLNFKLLGENVEAARQRWLSLFV